MSPADKSDSALLELFSKLVSTPPKLDIAAKEYVDKTFSFSNILSIYREKGLVWDYEKEFEPIYEYLDSCLERWPLRILL